MTGWYQKKIVPRLLNSEMGSEELKVIRQEVLRDASGIVLELGVGPGYNLALYKNITKLYALEPSAELVDFAKSRARNLSYSIEFLITGAENIPLPDSSVDTVVSTWTLCSVKDLKKVLAEVMRVLRPGGQFIFADHGASPSGGIHVAQTLFTSVTKYFTGNCHYNRQIEAKLSEAGFEITQMKHPTEKFKPLIYNYQGVAVKK